MIAQNGKPVSDGMQQVNGATTHPRIFYELTGGGRRDIRTRPPTSEIVDSADGFDRVISAHQDKQAVWATLNPVMAERKGAARDADITRRRMLLVDADPVRASNTSATDDEKQAAWELSGQVFFWLQERGWLPVLLNDSGNGFHLLYRIDLPNDDDAKSLVSRVLENIHKRFSNDRAGVDVTVSNASRVVKVPGTVARKGPETPERRHRWARILQRNDKAEIVTLAMLEAVAGPSSDPEPPETPDRPREDRVTTDNLFGGVGGQDNVAEGVEPVADQLRRLNVDVVRVKQLDDGRTGYVLTKCYCCGEAGDDRAMVTECPDGTKGYKCHGDRCTKRGVNYSSFQKVVDPGRGAYPLTEFGVAERFRDRCGARAIFAPGLGWHLWDDRRWAEDTARRVVPMMAEIVRGIEPPDKTKLTKAIKKHKRDFESRGHLHAALSLASTLPGVVTDSKLLDAKPDLFNCLNGTVDLTTGALRESNPGDLLTVMAPTAFDPEAKCDRWVQFLAEVFSGDSDLIAYVQQLLGAALFGEVTEHILPVFYGCGGNGKGTLVETVTAVLGEDFASAAPPGLLVGSLKDQHPTALASLYGKRFVVSSETEEGGRLRESIVKHITGGDTITARRMREDFWAFKPSHMLFLLTNHKPRITGTDDGIWRRVKLIPFTQKFEGTQRDPGLRHTLLAEAPGILAWIVRGAVGWNSAGRRLGDPPAVAEATADYRDSENPWGNFIAEQCRTDVGAAVSLSELGRKYSAWAVATGEPRLSNKQLAARLREKGFTSFLNNGTWFRGLKVKRCAADDFTSIDVVF